MRKVFIVVGFFVVLAVSNAEATTSYKVTSLSPSQSFLSSGTKYLPAVVRGTTGAVSALTTAQLALSSTRGGNLAAAFAFAGLAYGADKFFDWLDREGFPIDPTTKLPLKITSTDNWTPNPNYGHVNCLPTSGYECTGGVKYYPSVEARNADLYKEPFPNSGGAQPEFVDGAATYWNCVANSNQEDKFSVIKCGAYSPEYAQNNPTTTTSPATRAEVEAAIKTSLETDSKTADEGMTDALNRVNDALKDLNDTLRKSPYWNDIETDLDSSIKDSTKTNLDDKLADPNAEDNYAEDSADPKYKPSGGITKEEVKDAVKRALDDESGVSNPVDPTIRTPEKRNLTTVLNTFYNAIGNLPIVDTLNGITVNCSGSSVICLNLPSEYGGSYCYDCAPLTGSFNAIGTAMLSIITILCFIYLFKG